MSEKLPLHSNLVIFKYNPKHRYRSTHRLYIPIWLYSNDTWEEVKAGKESTLHSNLVIFKWRCWGTAIQEKRSLYSNLVIFKFCPCL